MNRILEFDPENENDVVNRLLLKIHKSIDENFPHAADASPIRLSVLSVMRCIVAEVSVSEPDDSLIAAITSPIVPSNSVIAASIACRRVAAACSLARSASVELVAMSNKIARAKAWERSATAAPEKR